jgi:hypothetical protein
VSGNLSLKNQHMIHVSHSKEIVQAMPNLLNSYDQEALKKNSETLLEKHDLNKFYTNLSQALLN